MSEEMSKLSVEKQNIKESMKSKAAQREATRVIESTTRRIVHMVFNPKNLVKVTPFTRKLKLLMEDDLDAFETEEHEKFEAYLEKFIDETLEEGEHNPVQYDENTNYELELNGIKHISFAVANNPFFKLEIEKYYPEAIVINPEGEILAWLGGDKN